MKCLIITLVLTILDKQASKRRSVLVTGQQTSTNANYWILNPNYTLWFILVPLLPEPIAEFPFQKCIKRALKYEKSTECSVCAFCMQICSFTLCSSQLHFLCEWQSTDHCTIITHTLGRCWTDRLLLPALCACLCACVRQVNQQFQ